MNKLSLIAFIIIAGCKSDTFDIDINDFEPVADMERLDYTKVHPATVLEYWEVRFSWGAGGPADRVLGSGGSKQRSELPATTRLALDSLRVPSGWNPSCLPAYCFTYMATVNNGVVSTIRTKEALRDFLGPIDSREEAALLVHAHSFFWHGERGTTGIRPRGDDWEFLALQLTKACVPVQTDRVLLRVTSAGEVREVDREVHEKLDNACI